MTASNPVPTASVLLWERVVAGDPGPDWLKAQGLDVKLGLPSRDSSYRAHAAADFVADARGCSGVLISGGIRITDDVLAQLPQLRVVSKIGVGVDTVDVLAATRRGVLVCNTPGGNDSVFVAEHAMSLMLALRKQLHVWTRDYLQRGGWRRAQVFASGIDGTTVGIVGFGRIGRELARRLAGWQVTVLIHDPWATALPAGVTSVELDELLVRSDQVSLHCPAAANGQPLLDARRFGLMRPGAVLINTARASLVDRSALLASLDEGRLAGAAIDVFDPEPPPPDDPLLAHPRILATPHVASWTTEGFFGRRRQAAENLAMALLGRPGASIVNPQARGPGSTHGPG